MARHELSQTSREKLRYSRRSLFDVAADAVRQENFFLLDEHFRSQPHIIAFSNRHFYEGQLRIMTERPRRQAHGAIRVEHVAGRRAQDTSVNPAEVDAVLRELAAVIDRTPPDGPAPSIGVVCPFRDQVDAILQRVGRTLRAAQIERHALVVGTAHSLQGDEKDIVILATSIDADYHPASLRFLENPSLFNVAVTRSRRQVIVVTSVTPDDLPAGLLREYLLHARDAMQPHPPSPIERDTWRGAVARALADRGLALWPNHPAAGYSLDLVASRDDSHLAILCDGAQPGRFASADPLEQHRILDRAGWAVRRVAERGWLADWYACVEHLVKGLGA